MLLELGARGRLVPRRRAAAHECRVVVVVAASFCTATARPPPLVYTQYFATRGFTAQRCTLTASSAALCCRSLDADLYSERYCSVVCTPNVNAWSPGVVAKPLAVVLRRCRWLACCKALANHTKACRAAHCNWPLNARSRLIPFSQPHCPPKKDKAAFLRWDHSSGEQRQWAQLSALRQATRRSESNSSIIE